MGQIVKRKKKGRPSKADLARRPISPAPPTESEVRRSLRRRNVRYDIDYYEDYFDEEDEDEEEERRREKKLKLVVKLNQRSESAEPARSHSRSSARAEHASDDEEEDEEDKPLKKRKINGGDLSESEEEEENNYDEEEERRKVQSKGHDSTPGTPNDRQSGIPLPDKKSLELILDKLQKKDTYGVYAEPVDPEELPDYHDVIENPMDFATVRKKLANGSYSTLDQFEVHPSSDKRIYMGRKKKKLFVKLGNLQLHLCGAKKKGSSIMQGCKHFQIKLKLFSLGCK